MIIVKLQGGLGNQMFQYAIGRHLAIKNKTSLYLDLWQLLKRNETIDYTFRNFELTVFNARFQVLKHDLLRKAYRKVYNFIVPLQYISESNHFYDPAILHLKGNIYLHGYWQNEKYFKGIKAILLEDLSFKIPPAAKNVQMLKQIKTTNSISLHIRRGDYITNTAANNFHGVCSKQYYEKAILYCKEKFAQPHFYIFSDDIIWAKENLKFEDAHTYVDYNKGENSFEDMRLMSACNHNIIANSSFSWWGAWLNTNPEKIVIAPEKWFRAIDTEIVPDEWIKM